MTELKSGVIRTPHNEGMSFDGGSDHISVEEGETEFYLKSEADKVIAEKDKEIQRLENLCESYRIDCDNLAIREANACKEIERDNKQIRRQKYKRCLNMVKWCKYWANYWKCCEPPDCSLFIAKAKYYRKWQKRWLKIAKQFKED